MVPALTTPLPYTLWYSFPNLTTAMFTPQLLFPPGHAVHPCLSHAKNQGKDPTLLMTPVYQDHILTLPQPHPHCHISVITINNTPWQCQAVPSKHHLLSFQLTPSGIPTLIPINSSTHRVHTHWFCYLFCYLILSMTSLPSLSNSELVSHQYSGSLVYLLVTTLLHPSPELSW